MESKNLMRAILVGTAVGDALGVPVEFQPREYLKAHPVTTMLGGGTHNQEAGTWSDDTSMSLCLADALLDGYSLTEIARKFILWSGAKVWTARGEVFDIGNTTREAIFRLKQGVAPQSAGSKDMNSNGNGSLMRILPLLPFIRNMSYDERIPRIVQVSSITHRHPRSLLGCIILVEFARLLITRRIAEAFAIMQREINATMPYPDELPHYHRILKLSAQEFKDIPESEIHSSGYVVDTLEASIWCLMNTSCYKTAVLQAVNLGADTDTTGAVTGALAAIVYGYDDIPKSWREKLANREAIIRLCTRWESRIR